MRIDPSGSNSIGNTKNTAQTQTANGTQSGQRGQTGSDGDQVDLSGASSLVSLSAGMISATREAKINGLTALVQSGQYHVDAGQVASAMVNSMLGA